MGSYLSQPITEKISEDGRNEYINFGSSSMQGWRVSQEDAHNCCADFGKNASFFAVYDGHGGAEVALYCAQKLPDFLKSVEAYQKGDFEQALKDAFIGFDSTLVDSTVVEELKKLASDVLDGSETEDDADDEENLAELWAERDMDLSAVLEKYKEGKKNPAIDKLSAGAKPSPFLRGRRNCTDDENAAGSSGPSSSNCTRRKLDENEDAVSSTSKQKSEEIVEAASSSGGPSSSKNKVASDPSSTNATTKSVDTNCSPVSSSTSKIEVNSIDAQMTNGDASSVKAPVSSQENEISTNSSKSEKVSSSSQSGSQSNGEISSNSSEKLANNSSISSTKDFDSADSSTDDDEYNEDKSTDGDNDEEEEDDDDDDEEEDDDEIDEEEGCYSYDDEDDGFLNNMVEGPGQSSGCTAVVALVVDRELFVANAGDSRCVLCRNGKTIEMSFDHKPEDEEESLRITKAGGRVTMDGRVNGGLNLSRAIGDHAYKLNKDLKPEEQMISAMPDVKKITLQDDDEFMVLACDGIWNYMSSEEVVDFVRKRLAENKDNVSRICEELFTNCLAPNTAGDGTGCDNMTAVIVQFKQSVQQMDDQVPNSRKRVASPVSVSSDNEIHKRLKTGDEDNDAVAVIEPTTS